MFRLRMFLPSIAYEDLNHFSFEPYLGYRYPPYTEEAFQALSAPANIKIPDH